MSVSLFPDLSITSLLGTVYPCLMSLCASGEQSGQVQLQARRSGGQDHANIHQPRVNVVIVYHETIVAIFVIYGNGVHFYALQGVEI